MKRCVLVSVLSLLFALLLPLAAPLIAPPLAAPAAMSARSSAPAASPASAGAAEAADTGAAPLRSDAAVAIPFLHDGEVRELTLEEYLPGVLAGEMPVTFEEEALQAQAVAARTFTLFHLRQSSANHPDAAVCDDPACCQVWVDEDALRARWGDTFEENFSRLRAAVTATDGQYLTYGGDPILACFHSSSAGYTENCAMVWGTSLPYLVSVESPETAGDVPNFVSTVEIAPEDFRETILGAYPDADIIDTLPPDWLGTRTLDTSGRVAAIRIGGASIPGTRMRSLFSLRSANFTLEWTGRSFLFTVAGCGHGAGMSQYGANVMAREGSTCREILAHYYPGTELASIPA